MGKIIIAHRREGENYGANMSEAFRDSVDSGADYIEFDVRRTGDGELVDCHMPWIGFRMINRIGYLPLQEAANRKGFSVQKISEILRVLDGRKKVVVDLKEKGYEKDVMDMVFGYYKGKDIMVTSGNADSLALIAENYKVLKGLILFKRSPLNLARLAFGFFPDRLYKRARADFIFVPYRQASERFLDECFNRKVPVYVWTVNERDKLEKIMKDYRISGVSTDRPRLAVNIR